MDGRRNRCTTALLVPKSSAPGATGIRNPQVGTLADGRVLQIHDRHSVATTDGTRPGEAVIGVLHTSGAFEVINASQVTSISVGVHPKVKQQLASRMERAKIAFTGEGKGAS